MNLSAESRIGSALKDLDGLSADALAALAGVAASRLSGALRGVRPLSNQEADVFLKLLSELKNLVALCSPVPVSLKNPTIIKRLLEEIKDGNLTISITRREEQKTGRDASWPTTIQEFLSMPVEISDGLRKNAEFRKHLESL